MKFRTKVELHGKTATGITVPPEVVEALGTSKKPAVKVTINDYTYRSTVAARNGKFMLPLSAENRQGAGVVAGDEIEVSLELDSEPREAEVPADFLEALERDTDARQAFEKLSYSHKRQHILAIEDAKTPETRQRRIEKAISTLQENSDK